MIIEARRVGGLPSPTAAEPGWHRRSGCVRVWDFLELGTHRAVRVDGVWPRQLRHRLGDIDERGPGSQARVAATDFLLERRGHAPVTLVG
jgi:hypothetical protein